jgi:hypothetical protein
MDRGDASLRWVGGVCDLAAVISFCTSAKG